MEAVLISDCSELQSLTEAMRDLVPSSEFDFRIQISTFQNIFLSAYVDIFRKGSPDVVLFERTLAERLDSPERLRISAARLARGLRAAVSADLPFFLAQPGKSLQAGVYNILFPPGHGGLLIHEAIGHLLEWRENGLLRNKHGVELAPEFLTIVDDPTLCGAFGSFLTDAEGERAARKTLLRNGKVEAFLERRGNSRRESASHPFAPRMSNTYVESANMGECPESLAHEAHLGVRRFGGGRVNHRTGRFELLVREAWQWFEGQQRPILPFLVRGSALGLLKSIRSAAGEAELYPSFCHGISGRVPVSYGQPYLLVDNLECRPLPSAALPWSIA